MYCIYTKDKEEGELKGKYSVRIAGILCSSQLTGYSRLVLLSLYSVKDVEFWSWNWTKEGIVCSFSSGKCYIPLCSTNSVINHHEFYKLQMEPSSKAWFPVSFKPRHWDLSWWRLHFRMYLSGSFSLPTTATARAAGIRNFGSSPLKAQGEGEFPFQMSPSSEQNILRLPVTCCSDNGSSSVFCVPSPHPLVVMNPLQWSERSTELKHDSSGLNIVREDIPYCPVIAHIFSGKQSYFIVMGFSSWTMNLSKFFLCSVVSLAVLS